MKRTPLKRGKKGLKRGRPMTRHRLTLIPREPFWTAARKQGRCRGPGPHSGPLQAHHAVYEQELRKRGLSLHDPRNALLLCKWCHGQHHARAVVLPLQVLTSQNVAYALEVLGEYGPDYLFRHYGGEDPRVGVPRPSCWHD